MSDLSALFDPRGAIVVGASAQLGKLGTAMAEAMSAFTRPVAGVNSKGGDGFDTSIAAAADRIRSAGGVADLVISCVPAGATADVVREAAATSVGAVLVCAGGFAEIGVAGAEAQTDLEAAASETGVRILGPNTSGFFVPGLDLRASFVPGAATLAAGRVGVVASSGGVNHMLSFRLARAGVGVSLGVGIGAGFDVDHAEVLDYLATDPSTAAVVLHIETIRDGAALVIGRTTDSAFAESHTGALATSWRTARSVLAQAGAVVVDDEEQLVAAAAALSRIRLRPHANPGVALITGQAGPGLIIDDAATAQGWRMPRLAEATQKAVARLLPPLTFQANPVDTGRPGPTFSEVVRTVADDPDIDLVAVYALAEPVLDLPAAVATASPSTPVLLATDGTADELSDAFAAADQRDLAIVSGPTALAWGVSALVADARSRAMAADTEPPVGSPIPADGPWDEIRSKGLLETLGLRCPPRARGTTTSEVEEAVSGMSGPFAVKLVDAAVLHKTEIGGVRLGVAAHNIPDALTELRSVGATEFLVEEMAPSGIDLILAVRRDPVFGPVVVVGIGGTAAEATADISIRSLPISRQAAEAMVDDLRARDVLAGWRGGPDLDRGELGRHIMRLGAALSASPGLAEIEINPLRLTTSGLIALDAVVITTQEGRE